MVTPKSSAGRRWRGGGVLPLDRHHAISFGINASFRQWISSTFGHPQQYSIPALHGIQVHKVFKYHATDMRRSRPCPAPPESQVRWLDIDLPEYGFSLGILHVMAHVMAAGASLKSPCTVAKTRFWNAVLTTAEARLHEPNLLVGDWNTGAHRVDETGKTFICAEHFANLSALGWTDMWRHHHPNTTEFTWYSKRDGVRRNGFRVDHAFATPSLRPRVTSCRYSHVERDARVTDYSMVIVEVSESALVNCGNSAGD